MKSHSKLQGFIFLVLMFIRPVVKKTFRLIGAFSLFFAIVMITVGFMNDNFHLFATFVFIAISFIAFVLRWKFDALILKISPEENLVLQD